MTILTHLASFILGIIAAFALVRAAARHVARENRQRKRRVLAIRRDDYTRLWDDVQRGLDAMRQLDELHAARLQRVRPPADLPPDLVEEINALLSDQEPKP